MLLLSPPAAALDLGVIGPAYAIAEPDLLVELQAKLSEKARTGELQQLERAARQRIVAAIETPPPVPGLARSEHPRTFYFDPSVVVGEPIVDGEGHVLVAAGTRTNPLDVVSLSQPLLFFDGRDAAQVRQAKALIERYGGKVKPILTAGSYLNLMRRWRLRCLLRPAGGPGAKTRHQRGAGPGVAGRQAPAHRCVGATNEPPKLTSFASPEGAKASLGAARREAK